MKKQIEEMAKALCDKACTEFCASKLCARQFNNDCLVDFRTLGELYNAGYRKIPEGAVVIEKLEYEKMRLLADECLDWRRKNCNVGELPKENAVVLTREEAEQVYRTVKANGEILKDLQEAKAVFEKEMEEAQKEFVKQFEAHEKQIRKETAERFAERLKLRLFEYMDNDISYDEFCKGNIVAEEIDEIAKEITEVDG